MRYFGAAATPWDPRGVDPYSTGGDASDWTSYTSPPSVTVEQAYPPARIPEEEKPSWWQELIGQGAKDIRGGLIDIFGRRVTPVAPTAPPQAGPGVPVWVYPVAGIAAVVVLVALTRRRSSVAGYRRRRRGSRR